MASIWQNNKILRRWEKKNQKNFVNGNFNYDLSKPLTDPLLDSISNHINIDKEYIYVGSGICDFISAIMSIPCWNRVYLSDIEFGLYERAAQIYDQKLEKIKGLYTKDFIENIKNCKSSETDLLCISSPRWFTGELFTKKQIKEILNVFKGTIMIDEAYIDYSGNEAGVLDLCLKYNRIIIARSFSKKFLASGFRTGYIVTKKKIEGLRTTIVPTHSVSSYSANFFTKLLHEEKLLKSFYDTRQYINKNRDLIYNALKNLDNIKIVKSSANFITLIFKNIEDIDKVYNVLKDLEGIQKFDKEFLFIKIWISNEVFSKLVINRIREVLQ